MILDKIVADVSIELEKKKKTRAFGGDGKERCGTITAA